MPTVSVLHILRTIKARGSIARIDLQQLTGLSWWTITNPTRERLDRRSGVLRSAPRLPGWTDVRVLDCLRARLAGFNPMLVLEHNVNCLAIAERWFGQAGQEQHVLCVHLGEGVGMGILWRGDIFR